MRRNQSGAPPSSAPDSEPGPAAGISASARLSLRTEFARTLQKTVTLGFGLPLFVRVFPRLLGGNGQDGEVRTVAADLPFFRIFSEKADELNVIDYVE